MGKLKLNSGGEAENSRITAQGEEFNYNYDSATEDGKRNLRKEARTAVLSNFSHIHICT